MGAEHIPSVGVSYRFLHADVSCSQQLRSAVRSFVVAAGLDFLCWPCSLLVYHYEYTSITRDWRETEQTDQTLDAGIRAGISISTRGARGMKSLETELHTRVRSQRRERERETVSAGWHGGDV